MLAILIVFSLLVEVSGLSGNASQFPGSKWPQCPPWSYSDNNNTCHCYDLDYIVLCSENGDKGGILQCHCLTYNSYTNETEEGDCIYNCYTQRHYSNLNKAYTSLPNKLMDLNRRMCSKFNRTGTLCSQCVDGTYPRAYSYDLSCTPCSGIWLNVAKYTLVAFVPLTVFYIFILLFRINIPSSRLQSFVLLSQLLNFPLLLRMSVSNIHFNKSPINVMIKLFGTILGIWNLDFFRLLKLDICFPLSLLTVISLDVLIALYPFVLILLTHTMMSLYGRNFKLIKIICKVPVFLATKFFTRNWDIKMSTIDAFVTFILLSHVKLLNVSFDLLVPVKLHSLESGNQKYVLYMDSSLQYFSNAHLWYAIPAVLILVILILHVIMLFLYPFAFFQKCINILPSNWQIFIRITVDSLQGRYKDGTELNTIDCRWFSAIPLALHIFISTLYSIGMNKSLFPYLVQVLILIIILVIIADPYKENFSELSSSFCFIMLFLAISFMTTVIGSDYSLIFLLIPFSFEFSLLYILTLSAFVSYIVFITIRWIYVHQKC